LTGTLSTATQNNVTKIGTQTSFATSGSIVQSGGSTTLLGTTVSSLTSSGDLTVDTNVLKVNTTTNRVGVNITSPTEALDVVGNVKASGTLNVTGLSSLGTLFVSGNTSIGEGGTGVNNVSIGNLISTNGSTLQVAVTGGLNVNANTLVVDRVNNRVGVNKATPTEALEVQGNLKVSGTISSAAGTVTGVTGTNTLISGTTTTSVTVALGVNWTRISLMGITAAANFSLNMNIPSPGTCVGETYGDNGANLATWTTSTAYIFNNTGAVVRSRIESVRIH
jgi:hypothetical protein